MLHDFLTENRGKLIASCRAKVSRRRAPRATPAELEYGIPLFLDQLTVMLADRAEVPDKDGKVGAERAPMVDSKLALGAALHGAELLGGEFTIDQVVHDYGDLCQSIMSLAEVQGAAITVDEFGELNMRLDNAIAAAVTEFSHQRDVRKTGATALATNERLGVLAHEMRNFLNTAMLAVAAIKAGGAGFGGATAGALDRSLIGMRVLIDSTLSEVRLESGPPGTCGTIDVSRFIAEERVAGALQAAQKGCELTVVPVEPGLQVMADRPILASAVFNLLQNAFKFTRPNTHVVLRAHASGDRVLIEVEDECGGLAPGVQEKLFEPFNQGGADRTGLGLGLSLSRRGVEACGGILSVRDMPGRGCLFSIDMPRAR